MHLPPENTSKFSRNSLEIARDIRHATLGFPLPLQGAHGVHIGRNVVSVLDSVVGRREPGPRHSGVCYIGAFALVAELRVPVCRSDALIHLSRTAHWNSRKN